MRTSNLWYVEEGEGGMDRKCVPRNLDKLPDEDLEDPCLQMDILLLNWHSIVSAIREAGGWKDRTIVVEDMDLTARASIIDRWIYNIVIW
jgi:hypothetical protein